MGRYYNPGDIAKKLSHDSVDSGFADGTDRVEISREASGSEGENPGEATFQGDCLVVDYDYITWYVSNPKQAAEHMIIHFGFKAWAYKGLETGSREVSCHVVANGKIVLCFVGVLKNSGQRENSLTTNRFMTGVRYCRRRPVAEEYGAIAIKSDSIDSDIDDPDSIRQFLQVHGDAVKDIAFAVTNVETAYDRAVSNGATPLIPPRFYHSVDDDSSFVEVARVGMLGDITHTFTDRRKFKGNTRFLPGFILTIEHEDPVDRKHNVYNALEDVPVERIDHVVQNVDWGEMDEASSDYKRMFAFKKFWSVDEKTVATEFSSLRSVVMASENNLVKMPINEPAEGLRKSQIEEFIDYHNGTGVQHIAILVNDIIETIDALNYRGVEFNKVPDSYYDYMKEKLTIAHKEGKFRIQSESMKHLEINEFVNQLQARRVLIDYDDKGYLLQVFTKPLMDRPTIFFEYIERHGFNGFGAGNFKTLFESIEIEQQKRGNL